MSVGIAASINTFLCSTNTSKKEILNYLLSLIAISLSCGNLKLVKLRTNKFGINLDEDDIKKNVITGGLLGTGLGLFGSTVINCLAPLLK